MASAAPRRSFSGGLRSSICLARASASVVVTAGKTFYYVKSGEKSLQSAKASLEKLDLERTYFLFSSEPFPFHKKKALLLGLNVSGSIVDGESLSWFGTRSLRYLEQVHFGPKLT
jgi:7-cyano-7-deazaguanine synthase in queuosine biosynthesis